MALVVLWLATQLAGISLVVYGVKWIFRGARGKAVEAKIVERFERGDSPVFPAQADPPEYVKWAEDRLSDYSLARLKALPSRRVYFIYLVDYEYCGEIVRAPLFGGPMSDRWEPGAKVHLLINPRDPRMPEVRMGDLDAPPVAIGCLVLTLGCILLLAALLIFENMW